MGKRLYLGNISYYTTEDELTTLLAQFGEVAEVTIVYDRDTGRSKGFGFVEMVEDSAALEAVERLNGTEVRGRTIKVAEARPRPTRFGEDRRDSY